MKLIDHETTTQTDPNTRGLVQERFVLSRTGLKRKSNENDMRDGPDDETQLDDEDDVYSILPYDYFDVPW